MSIARHIGLAVPLAVCWLLASAPALAEGPTKAERAAARTAYDKGTLAFGKGDYAKALDSFVKANALIPSIQAMYWIALAQDKLGHTEAAIEAYEAITARADFPKLSPDKASTVNERLAALKPPPPPPPPPTSPPPPPAQAPAPAPESVPSEPSDSLVTPMPVSEWPSAASTSALPKGNTFELGLMVGALLVPDSNNLVEAGREHATFEQPVWQAGLRAAYFPLAMLGVEVEWAHGFGSSKASESVRSGAANFDAVRGHLIGQLPTTRFVPFALLGAGLLYGSSKPGGSDSDFVLEAGLGAKYMATKLLVPRIDFRLGMTQKQGGGFGDGVALLPEVLLGLGFTLGR